MTNHHLSTKTSLIKKAIKVKKNFIVELNLKKVLKVRRMTKKKNIIVYKPKKRKQK